MSLFSILSRNVMFVFYCFMKHYPFFYMSTLLWSQFDFSKSDTCILTNYNMNLIFFNSVVFHRSYIIHIQSDFPKLDRLLVILFWFIYSYSPLCVALIIFYLKPFFHETLPILVIVPIWFFKIRHLYSNSNMNLIFINSVVFHRSYLLYYPYSIGFP